jgi:hypothetical protein
MGNHGNKKKNNAAAAATFCFVSYHRERDKEWVGLLDTTTEAPKMLNTD